MTDREHDSRIVSLSNLCPANMSSCIANVEDVFISIIGKRSGLLRLIRSKIEIWHLREDKEFLLERTKSGTKSDLAKARLLTKHFDRDEPAHLTRESS